MSVWLPVKQKGKWQFYLVPTHCAITVLALFSWALACLVMVVLAIVRAIF